MSCKHSLSDVEDNSSERGAVSPTIISLISFRSRSRERSDALGNATPGVEGVLADLGDET